MCFNITSDKTKLQSKALQVCASGCIVSLMATVFRKTDDLDGSDASETVVFTLDGLKYELDLSSSNAMKFRELLSPYTQVGRRQGGKRTAGNKSVTKRVDLPASASTIRAWAKSAGKDVPPRGRLPKDIVDEYEKVNANGVQSKPQDDDDFDD
jgi:Lsr2